MSEDLSNLEEDAAEAAAQQASQAAAFQMSHERYLDNQRMDGLEKRLKAIEDLLKVPTAYEFIPAPGELPVRSSGSLDSAEPL